MGFSQSWKGNATTFHTHSKRNLDSIEAAEKFTDETEK